MKKIILILFLLNCSLIFSQNLNKEDPPPHPTQYYLFQVYDETEEAFRFVIVGSISDTSLSIISDSILANIKENNDILQDVKDELKYQHTTSLDTILTITAITATRLPDIPNVKEIIITNLQGGALLRVGKDATVATQGRLFWYGDSFITTKESNVNKLWVYTDVEAVISISWGF
jgi:hypothetical protein